MINADNRSAYNRRKCVDEEGAANYHLDAEIIGTFGEIDYDAAPV